MILVTGATGFVGRALVQRLLVMNESQFVAVAVRQHIQQWPARVLVRVTGDLEDWSVPLGDISVVVHCAARVHVMVDKVANPLAEFRRVNVQGTLNLARQAAASGVRRFVFLSSIKVNGEATQLGYPFTADDAPAPLDAYGVSKLEAEQGLREVARQTGIEVVIIRPPLVYGPGVKSNFAAMIHWLKSGVPLPLGAIHNQRSLVSIDNLVDLIVTCLTHPVAANQTFLVSDGEDVSTTVLLRRMSQYLGRPARLIPVPVSWLKLTAAFMGKRDMAQRLCGSLQVDIEKTWRLLGWMPLISLDEGLKRTGAMNLRDKPEDDDGG
jgi:nucleoside-diphosphate-sugar epimerase